MRDSNACEERKPATAQPEQPGHMVYCLTCRKAKLQTHPAFCGDCGSSLIAARPPAFNPHQPLRAPFKGQE